MATVSTPLSSVKGFFKGLLINDDGDFYTMLKKLKNSNLSGNQRKRLIARLFDCLSKVEIFDSFHYAYQLLEEHPSDLNGDQCKQMIARLIDFVQFVGYTTQIPEKAQCDVIWSPEIRYNAISAARLLLKSYPSDLNGDQRKQLIAPLVNYGIKGSVTDEGFYNGDLNSIRCAYFLLEICASDPSEDERKQLIARIIGYAQVVPRFEPIDCICFLLKKYPLDLNDSQRKYLTAYLADYVQFKVDRLKDKEDFTRDHQISSKLDTVEGHSQGIPNVDLRTIQ